MADSAQIGILRRKMRPEAQPRRPRDGAGEIWRRILPRLAAEGLGLELAVSGYRQRPLDLHAELSVEEGSLLLFLAEGAVPDGLAVLDPALMTGLIEVQTTGQVGTARREPRRTTAVDAALASHVVDTWLAGVAGARGDTDFPTTFGAAPDLRGALLKLEEGDWVETRVEVDLGGGKRSGRISLYRPAPGAADAGPSEPDALRAMLLPVEATLVAVLCRVRVPLGTVATLQPGQVIPLPDVSVRQVRLEAPIGRFVTEVHLGQSGGFRAVRILGDRASGDPPRPLQAASGTTGGVAGLDLLPALPDIAGMVGPAEPPPLPGL